MSLQPHNEMKQRITMAEKFKWWNTKLFPQLPGIIAKEKQIFRILVREIPNLARITSTIVHENKTAIRLQKKGRPLSGVIFIKISKISFEIKK